MQGGLKVLQSANSAAVSTKLYQQALTLWSSLAQVGTVSYLMSRRYAAEDLAHSSMFVAPKCSIVNHPL